MPSVDPIAAFVDKLHEFGHAHDFSDKTYWIQISLLNRDQVRWQPCNCEPEDECKWDGVLVRTVVAAFLGSPELVHLR